MSDVVVETPVACWCCGSTKLIQLESGNQYCYDCMAEPRR